MGGGGGGKGELMASLYRCGAAAADVSQRSARATRGETRGAEREAGTNLPCHDRERGAETRAVTTRISLHLAQSPRRHQGTINTACRIAALATQRCYLGRNGRLCFLLHQPPTLPHTFFFLNFQKIFLLWFLCSKEPSRGVPRAQNLNPPC